MQEKIDILNTLGADVRPVPAVPFDDPMNYNHQVINVHFSLELFSESNSINELIYSLGTVDDPTKLIICLNIVATETYVVGKD